MKKQQFKSIAKEQLFLILGGRVTLPITDPNSDPDAGKSKDEEEPVSAS